jgi:hypothetical protein
MAAVEAFLYTDEEFDEEGIIGAAFMAIGNESTRFLVERWRVSYASRLSEVLF